MIIFRGLGYLGVSSRWVVADMRGADASCEVFIVSASAKLGYVGAGNAVKV